MEQEEDRFKIYAGRLKHGEIEEISESFTPEFLGVSERELRFEKPVEVNGEAYITDDTLILHLNITTEAKLPCSICNKMSAAPIELQGFYHTVPLTDIKSAVYDYRTPLREAILLEVPLVIECHGGRCPERDEIGKYLGSPDIKKDEYHPFEDLENRE